MRYSQLKEREAELKKARVMQSRHLQSVAFGIVVHSDFFFFSILETFSQRARV